MDSHNRMVIATCAVCVGVTAVLSAVIAREWTMRHGVEQAPPFEVRTATDFFPLQPGNRWVYEGAARNETGQGTMGVDKNFA